MVTNETTVVPTLLSLILQSKAKEKKKDTEVARARALQVIINKLLDP